MHKSVKMLNSSSHRYIALKIAFNNAYPLKILHMKHMLHVCNKDIQGIRNISQDMS